MAGRKPLSPQELAYKKVSAERIKAFFQSKKGILSIRQFAKQIHASESTIRGYIRGSSHISYQIAIMFQKETGIIYPYWLGETEAKTWEEYGEEEARIKAAEEQEKAAAEGFMRIVEDREFQIRKAKLESFFSMLDYRCSGEKCENGEKRFTLTDERGYFKDIVFDDGEVGRLLDSIREVVELECYKKTRE